MTRAGKDIYKNIEIYILQVWGVFTPVLLDYRLDAVYMTSKTTTTGKWWILPGMMVGIVLAIVTNTIHPYLGSTSTGTRQVLAPPSGHHTNTLVVPTPTLSSAHPPTVVPTCPYDVYHGPNCSQYAMVTYDDCPKTWAAFRTMVDYVSSTGFTMVIFPTGNCLKKYERLGHDLAGYARTHGIWVGNHSVTHPHFYQLTKAGIVKELGAPGVVTNVGRPPYGEYDSRIASAYEQVDGMKAWVWNVDTNDWQGKSQASVVAYVVAHVKAGQTVLMHMQWHGFNPDAFRQMATGLFKRGVRVCHVYRGADMVGPVEATSQDFPANIPCGP